MQRLKRLLAVADCKHEWMDDVMQIRAAIVKPIIALGHLGRRKWRPILLSLAITLIFVSHSAGFVSIPGLARLEAQLYDARVRYSADGQPDERIVILDIDEKSLAEIGRWPWNRIRIAEIIDRLFNQYGIAVLGFDIVWAESETSQFKALGQDVARRLPGQSIGALPDTDAVLAQSIANRPVVLGYYFNSAKGGKNSLPQPVLTLDQLPATASIAPLWPGYTGNIAELAAAAPAAGQINALPDDDGIIRRVPLLMRHGAGYYEGLSLAMLRAMFGGMPVEPVIARADGYARVEGLKLGPLTVPVDREMAALVSYRGPQRTYDYVSLADVLQGRVKPERLAGRIALIGTSAPGLSDIRATPTDAVMPGVEVHANMISAMLDQKVRQQPAYVTGLDVAQVALVGLCAALVLPLLGAAAGIGLVAALAALILWLNTSLWTSSLLVVPLATALVLLGTLFLFNMAWGFLIEGRSKRQLGSMFSQYIPPSLVAEMARDPERYTMENRDAHLTVLFADVRGFTTISEALTAKELAAYINEYLTRMSAIIAAGRGTLDKFIGDAIMAFWGAPIDDVDHARHAVTVAMAMREEQQALSADFAAKGWPPIDIGIGLNSGPMRVGNMGSKHRLAYTVMGDAVNLGSRLEGLTKNYGVGIIIGAATRAAVPDIACRLLDRVRVKGKNEAVEIFEPVAADADLDAAARAEIENWNALVADYFAQNWRGVGSKLKAAQKMGTPSGLVALFEDRLAEMKSVKLPTNWDGVTTFKTK